MIRNDLKIPDRRRQTWFAADPGSQKIIWRRLTPVILLLAFVCGMLLQPQMTADAQAALTIEPLTWDIVGLDATTPDAGPDVYPVGARVCYTGQSPASNITVSFSWLGTANPLISLVGASVFTIPTLANNGCRDIYFTISVNPSPAAFGTTRGYMISATASGITTVSTPETRQIYVERLDPRTRLTTDIRSGPQNVTVGQSYEYVVESATGGDAYQQLEHFLKFSSSGVRLVQAASTYTIPAGAENDRVYADACGWDPEPASTNYRTCIGNGDYTAPISGTLVTTYTVEVLAAGTYTLTHTLFGLSGESYFYNSNFQSEVYTITAANPVTPTQPGDGFLPIILKDKYFATPLTPTPQGGTQTTVTATTPPPTPTYTGTINPTMGATKLVNPASARIGQSVTFTFRVVNSGTAPAEDVILTDNLGAYTYINITNLETTRGTVNINARTAIVNIGTINPGEVVVVTLVVTVNSTATTVTNVCNTASISYRGGPTRSSNQMCFQSVGGPVLPGTGELPLETGRAASNWQSWLFSVVLLTVGIAAAAYALITRKSNETKSAVVFGMGILLSIAALVILANSAGLFAQPQHKVDIVSEIDLTEPTYTTVLETPTPTINPLALNPSYLFATPVVEETLPSYPIPSPTINATPQPGESGPDTSPVVRLSIPKIEVDAKVAYVPFDGHSWLITGLREEVAWMGDTSWPGLGGNTGLAGHVTVRGLPGGGPFRYLVDLVHGDVVQVYTERNMYTYVVRNKLETDQMDLAILRETDNSQITMITCIDWDERLEAYLKRLVVVADLVKVEPLAYYQGN